MCLLYGLQNRINPLNAELNPIRHLLALLGAQQEEDSLYQQIGLKFEEETSKMLHLEHGFVWC